MTFLGTRVLTTAATLIGAMLLLFALSAVVPGNPADTLLGPQASPEYAQAVHRPDGPGPADSDPAVALLHWPSRSGDLGRDVISGRSPSAHADRSGACRPPWC